MSYINNALNTAALLTTGYQVANFLSTLEASGLNMFFDNPIPSIIIGGLAIKDLLAAYNAPAPNEGQESPGFFKKTFNLIGHSILNATSRYAAINVIGESAAKGIWSLIKENPWQSIAATISGIFTAVDHYQQPAVPNQSAYSRGCDLVNDTINNAYLTITTFNSMVGIPPSVVSNTTSAVCGTVYNHWKTSITAAGIGSVILCHRFGASPNNPINPKVPNNNAANPRLPYPWREHYLLRSEVNKVTEVIRYPYLLRDTINGRPRYTHGQYQ